jgi:TM2 domain-containing membrane protein YozV
VKRFFRATQNILFWFVINIITIFVSSDLYPQSTDSSKDIHAPANRLKFGNHLYKQKDYLRAIDEYNFYLKFNNNDTVEFKIAQSLFKMEKYFESSEKFKDLMNNLNLSDDAELGYYKSIFFIGDFNSFRTQLNKNYHVPSKYIREINKLYYITYLFDNEILPDSSEFYESFNLVERKEICDFYNWKSDPPYKSPALAAVLSTIIPGLGKIYTEEYGDGITALLSVGLLSFLAYDNFKADHQFRAWLFTGLAAIFYAGNIYGSAASAQIYNAGIQFNFENDLNFYLNKNNYFLPTYNDLLR